MSIDTSSRKGQRKKLQSQLLVEMARTGQLLERARREKSEYYQTILETRGISPSEADDYICVFLNIETIKIAEQWYYNDSRETLKSPKDVLNLLTKWRNQRH